MKHPLTTRTAFAWGLAALASAVLFTSIRCHAEEPSPPAGPSATEPAPAPVAGPPAPAGMVYVDATGAKIGTSAEEVLKLAGKREDVLKVLLYETPVHAPKLPPYFLDLYEVSNAQYLHYLLAAGKKEKYTTGAGLGNLEEISSYFAYGDPMQARKEGDKSSWRQLYELNKGALHKALPDLLKDENGSPLGEKEVRERFRLAALPTDLELTVFKARLPYHWFDSSDQLEGDALPNHPVRDVSFQEAQAFAEWAGKHVMTEPEYEWAARGPDGRRYPWGNDWSEGLDEGTGERIAEKRCNWADLKIISKTTYEPMTLPVDSLPEGASWVGAHHLLGNVAEMTSTWFGPYPGWTGSLDQNANFWASYHGEYVHVIRGGSCADRERIALRASYRDFVGVARLGPPKPDMHYAYAGFRCALYLTPAQDRLEPSIARLLRPKKIREEQVVRERFKGVAAHRFAPAGAPVTDHVYVQGAAHAVLIAPLARLYTDMTKKPDADTADELKKVVPSPDPLPFGILHTDVPIRVKIRDPKAPVDEESKGRRERRKPDPSKLPPLIDGTLEPDTYVLGLSNNRVGVYRSNLDFVAFLDKATIKDRVLKKDEAPPASTLEVDPDVDLIKDISLWIPIGGKGVPPIKGVTIEWSMEAEAGTLEKAGTWR